MNEIEGLEDAGARELARARERTARRLKTSVRPPAEDAKAIVEILREFRREGCNDTRRAMAGAIYDLRNALRDVQAALMRASDGGRVG